MSPSGSASSIVADTTEGYHFLTIRDYSRTKCVPTGERIGSLPFTIGGHCWRIYYFPNGVRSEVADYVSFSLELDEDVPATVKAQVKICFAGEEEEAEQAASLALASVDEFTSQKCRQYEKFIKREILENSRHLKNDSFSIRCDIAVIHGYRGVDGTTPFICVLPWDVRQNLGKYIETNKRTHEVFEVGTEIIAVHYCVLVACWACSPVLEAELYGAIKEDNTAAAGVVHVEGMEVEVFKALLDFAYTGRLPQTSKEDDEVMCQRLLVAADRYGIVQLKLLCEEWMCKYIDVGTAATILALAEQNHCEGLRKACFDFLAAPGN